MGFRSSCLLDLDKPLELPRCNTYVLRNSMSMQPATLWKYHEVSNLHMSNFHLLRVWQKIQLPPAHPQVTSTGRRSPLSPSSTPGRSDLPGARWCCSFGHPDQTKALPPSPCAGDSRLASSHAQATPRGKLGHVTRPKKHTGRHRSSSQNRNAWSTPRSNIPTRNGEKNV